MANYLLVYHGGATMENATPEQQAETMRSWQSWMGGLGSKLIDSGNPISRAWTRSTDGTTEGGGANPATGYSIVTADSMQDALDMTTGCPHLASGGTIEICETFNVA